MTQNLKGLFLDRSKIDAALRSFHCDAVISGPTVRGSFTEYEIDFEDQETAKLHVYHLNDSTTTLTAAIGRNQALSLQVAQHVEAQCKRKEHPQRTLGIEHISEADWDSLLKKLAEEHGLQVTQGVLPYGVRFDIKKAKGDQVNLNRYNKGGRLLMQGKSREAYAAVVEVLSELLADKREVVAAQLKSYDVTSVRVEDLFHELRQHAPSAIDFLGETGAAVIAPALALSKLDIQLPDYSCIAYPALRGLELYFKALMAKRNHPVLSTTGFNNYLDSSNKRLKKSIRDSMTPEEATAIEECYLYHKDQRHPLFHADANPDMTRIIVDKDEAVALLYSVLRLIESTAAAIPDHAR